MYNLSGQIALVTGAGRGIGRAITLRLAREGADVAAVDVDAGALEALAGEVKAFGRRVITDRVDVTESAEVERFVQRIVGEFSRIDILVNNAGINRIVPLLQMAEPDWDALFDVNVKAVWICSKVVANQMIRQARQGSASAGRESRGKIINAASRAGKSPSRLAPIGAYVATKHAVIGFTRALAMELAEHKINVNAYCPGVVDTPMWDQIDRETARYRGVPIGSVKAEAVAQIPLGRIEQPEDVANLVAFLASSESDYMTGQAINITGGSEVH